MGMKAVKEWGRPSTKAPGGLSRRVTLWVRIEPWSHLPGSARLRRPDEVRYFAFSYRMVSGHELLCLRSALCSAWSTVSCQRSFVTTQSLMYRQ